jgi:hypothetical protein
MTWRLNVQFLRMSWITISINKSLRDEENRIVEIANRAHQLNFTKRELTAGALASLLTSPGYTCWSIAVTDRFAEYGLCGFACVDKHAHQLLHFVFSCRILNMGVEQFIYAQLGRPRLRVVQLVSSDPLQGPTPDWMEVEPRFNKMRTMDSNTPPNKVGVTVRTGSSPSFEGIWRTLAARLRKRQL